MFTVSGPMRSSTYMTSRYAGFFVLVLAHSGRCTRAPRAASASHRAPENRSRKSAYASFAFATATRPRNAFASSARAGFAATTASSRFSASVSTRLTKNDATEAIVLNRQPAARALLERREIRLDDRGIGVDREEQRDVDVDALGEQPPRRDRPSAVPGTLIITFGRSTAAQSRRASAIVSLDVVRGARRHLDRDVAVHALGLLVHRPKMSHAARTSSVSMSSNNSHALSSGDAPASCASYASPSASAFSKIVGFEVIPVSASSLNAPRELAAAEQ